MVTTSVDTGLDANGITVEFGATTAVQDASIRVAPGEIVALVGPSGCGKSSLLRAIAGLEVTSRGSVRWDGIDISRVPAHERGFGLMFQEHALFPHRNVAENVGFGLRMHRVAKQTRTRRVDEVLEMVGLAGCQSRSVDTLSGGEAQRVALARALAPSPRLLMLDEPLGALDRVLRDRLANDLRTVLQELDQAAIHVTHDQQEAYAIADRIVVMKAGLVMCDGPVTDVWRDPRSEFVARFLGHDNVLDARTAAALGIGDGRGSVLVHEAALQFGPSGSLCAQVTSVRFQGAMSRLAIRVDVAGYADSTELVVHTNEPPTPGATVRFDIDPTFVVALTPFS